MEARASRRARQEIRLRSALRDWSRRNSSQVWRAVEAEQKQTGKSFADDGTTEEAARADYRKIAERRVRLGLLLADVGEAAGVKVSEEEVRQALVERARSFPGQEKVVWDFYQKNPDALAETQGPDLRGEGRRSHPRPDQGDRQDGSEGGAAEGRPTRTRRPRVRAGPR